MSGCACRRTFSENAVRSVVLPELNARVYGAAFTGKSSPALLTEFHAAEEPGVWKLLCLHGEVGNRASAYDPITEEELAQSGLDYAALGHIHKASGLKKAGNTWYSWPGCAEGRGFDECGEKTVNLVTLEEDGGCEIRAVPIAARRYEILPVDVSGDDPLLAIITQLPDDTVKDVYRIVLTGDTETAPDVKKLYDNLSDSACMVSLPAAATRTDDWGFFVIRNIPPKEYRIYAYSDGDKDNMYMQGEDFVAFHDTLFTPHRIVRDSIYELLPFDMKDTVACQLRESELQLMMFKETATRQFVKNKGRADEKRGFLKFNAHDVEINSFQIFGIDSSDIITRFNPEKDSLDFWINTSYRLPDSLLITMEYIKTDSLGNLAMTQEDLAVSLNDEQKAELKEKAKTDTLVNVQYDFKNENIEQDGITLRFPDPLAEMHIDSIMFITTNQRNQNDTIPFLFTKDSTEFEVYRLQSSQTYQQGYKYQVVIPESTFIDIYGRKNKANTINLELPDTDRTGSITLNVSGIAGSRYIIELVSPDKRQVYRKFNVEEDTSLYFPYLKEGQYTFRITEDRNRNGIFDSGNLLEKRQPERVILFKMPDGAEIIELPEQTDIEQDLKL